jgi:hypothetical protein
MLIAVFDTLSNLLSTTSQIRQKILCIKPLLVICLKYRNYQFTIGVIAMDFNITNSALQGLNSAQQKANNAAQQIASLPIKANEVGSANFNSTSLIKPVLSLSEAELQNSAAVKILKTQKETLGNFIDTVA